MYMVFYTIFFTVIEGWNGVGVMGVAGDPVDVADLDPLLSGGML